MKKELPKLLRIVAEHEFYFEIDAEESHLYENRIKSRNRRRKNVIAMQVLRSNELQIRENDNVHAVSATDLL